MARYTKSEKLSLMIAFKKNYTNQPYWKINAIIKKTIEQEKIRICLTTFYYWRKELFKTAIGWNRFLYNYE